MRISLLMLGLLLAACQPITETTTSAMDATKRSVDTTQAKWKSLFSYKEPKPAQLPQSRYCYQMSSDVVCYDSPQSGMTAVLRGYQDGPAMSGFQPGGGSLGVSGGEPTAGYNTPYIQSPDGKPIELKALSNVSDVPPSGGNVISKEITVSPH